MTFPGDDNMARAIREATDDVRARLATLDAETLERLEENTQFDAMDFVALRNRRALAGAAGKLSFEASMLMYGIEEGWRTADLASRIVWIQVMGELGPNVG